MPVHVVGPRMVFRKLNYSNETKDGGEFEYLPLMCYVLYVIIRYVLTVIFSAKSFSLGTSLHDNKIFAGIYINHKICILYLA